MASVASGSAATGSPPSSSTGARSSARRVGDSRSGHHREFVIYGDSVEAGATRTVEPKSDADRASIRESLLAHFLFAELSKPQLEGVIDVMAKVSVDAGEAIIKQGDDGDRYYIVAEGIFDIDVSGTLVATRGPGTSFGELSLMYNTPRAATVKAKVPSTLWALDRATFRRALVAAAEKRRTAVRAALSATSLLAPLGRSAISVLSDAASEISFHMGETVYAKGSLSDALYLVKSGTVQVRDVGSRGDGTVAVDVGEGDFFGERAILGARHRWAAVTVTSASAIVVKIDVEALRPHQAVLAEVLHARIADRALRAVPVLRALTLRELRALVAAAQAEVLTKGNIVVRKGQAPAETPIRVLVAGQAAVQSRGRTTAFARPGDAVGELGATAGIAAPFTVVVTSEACRFVRVQAADFAAIAGSPAAYSARLPDEAFAPFSRTIPLAGARPSGPVLASLADPPVFATEAGADADTAAASTAAADFAAATSSPDAAALASGAGDACSASASGTSSACPAGPAATRRLGRKTSRRNIETAEATDADLLGVGASVEALKALERDLDDEMTIADLEVMTTLGIGTFGRVKMVKDRRNGKFYALKALQKGTVIRLKQQKNVVYEKAVLAAIRHPFLIRLVAAFQDELRLYMVLELVQGGELFGLLDQFETLEPPHAGFYAACVLSGLRHLHERRILYRDLKPENLLLDRDGYIRICDFGFAKHCPADTRTYTLCGTPEYLAPECIRSQGHNESADYWALGVLIYEMLCGQSPFVGETESQAETFKRILRADAVLEFPDFVTDRHATDLISRLLRVSIPTRLGCGGGGVDAISSHSFFRHTDWHKLVAKSIQAPWVPELHSADDVSHFESYDDEEEGPREEPVPRGADLSWCEQF